MQRRRGEGWYWTMAVYIRRGRRLIDLFASMERGKLLDFPTGWGKEYVHLSQLGYQVVPADLFTHFFTISGRTCVQANGNATFPFKGGSFDYVLSRESIEHLENQASFVRECARVLKPGGKLVLTTPNVLHLISRLSYFLTGQRILRRGLVNEIQTLKLIKNGEFFHGHAFLIDYFRLRYILRLSGFGRIKVFTDRYSRTSVALLWTVPILFVAVILSIWMSVSKDRKIGKLIPDRSVFREILGHIFSPALLLGKRIVVMAEKLDT
ncbi:MAG: methyltransferase domain-containing protein [Candidatus Binatia bacterium]